jgi:hypothetical protein
MAREIHRHKEVLGSDGAHVATLDRMEGAKWITLTKDNPAAIGTHHIVPIKWSIAWTAKCLRIRPPAVP